MKALALTLLFALSACGFRPLYGESSPEVTKLAGIAVDPIDTRLGQILKAQLEDGINPTDANGKRLYRLNIQLNVSSSAIGVARDGTISRYNVFLNSTYQLTRIADDKVIARGPLNQVSSYNNVSNVYFSTYVSEADAQKRSAIELAERYRLRLAAIIELPEAPEPPPLKKADENRTQRH